MTRPLKKPPYQGPWLPSYDTQHNTSEKSVLVWTRGTQSTKQVKRNLRAKARVILDSKDRRVILVGQRVTISVMNEPDPEFATLHLFCAALDASQQTGESWATFMTYLMDKFDAQAATSEDPHVETETEARPELSFFGRLFRAVVPGRRRARHEESAGAGVDQPPRDGHREHGHEG